MEFMVLPGEGEDWDILLGNDFLHMADVVIFPKDGKLLFQQWDTYVDLMKCEYDENAGDFIERTWPDSTEGTLAVYQTEVIDDPEYFEDTEWETVVETDISDFVKYFYTNGVFMLKNTYSKEENEFMLNHINISDRISQLFNEEQGGSYKKPPNNKPRIWEKPPGINPEDSDELFNLLASYDDLFANSLEQLETCDQTSFRIINDDVKPIYRSAYRKSKSENDIIRILIDELISNNWIRASRSPWASPALLVPKPDNKFRLVIDYRELNKVTKSHPYPMPRLVDIFDSMWDSQWFTLIDLKAGFKNSI